MAIGNVLRYAKTLDDKKQAHLHQLLCKIDRSSDYKNGVIEGIKILNLYGFDIPKQDISKTYIAKEEMKLKLALKNRSYSCLTKLQVTDDSIFYLFFQIQKYCLFTGNEKMMKVLTWKAIQLATKKGMDRNLPAILCFFATSLAKQGKVKTAQELGHVSIAMLEKFPQDVEMCALTKSLAYSSVFPLLQSFRSIVDPLLQTYTDLKLIGGLVEPMFGA